MHDYLKQVGCEVACDFDYGKFPISLTPSKLDYSSIYYVLGSDFPSGALKETLVSESGSSFDLQD